MNSKELFLDNLNNTLPDLKDEITITSLAELGITHVLHISDNPEITEFIPAVPHRAVREQDHRLPRVCTSTCLTGCIIGYNGISHDFLERTWDDTKYLGGYIIYGFAPEIVITPSTKLLRDQKITDEQWLVSYSPDTVKHVPVSLGKIFLNHVGMSRQDDSDEDSETNKRVQTDYELYVEVFEGYEIPWTLDDRLKAGFYKIIAKGLMMSGSCLNPNPYDITIIDQATYLAAKNLTASLLSYTIPPSMKW